MNSTLRNASILLFISLLITVYGLKTAHSRNSQAKLLLSKFTAIDKLHKKIEEFNSTPEVCKECAAKNTTDSLHNMTTMLGTIQSSLNLLTMRVDKQQTHINSIVAAEVIDRPRLDYLYEETMKEHNAYQNRNTPPS